MSSSSSRRSGGRATLSATAQPLCGRQRPARDGESHARPAQIAYGSLQAGGAGRSGNQACEPTSFACAEIGHQRFHRVVHVAVRDVVPGPGRIPALVSDPVQLSLTLLQRLKRAILLQGDHDRLDLACPEDHLMVGDLSIERQGAITHAYESTPKRNVGQYPTSSLATRPANCNARGPDSRDAPNPRSLTASSGAA